METKTATAVRYSEITNNLVKKGPVQWDAGEGFRGVAHWCPNRKRIATTLYNPDGSINSVGSMSRR